MHRRQFVRQIGATTLFLGAGLPSTFAMGKEEVLTELTILHTNDWHSRIDPFPMDGGRNAGRGGAVRRAGLLDKIRAEVVHTLLLDAGDIFQGTPYFNYYNGELEFKLMSAMRYDLATIGNHDFDAGIDNLAHQLQQASFGLVNCNYDFSNTPLQGRVAPYRVFEKGPIRIGVLGVGIALEGLVAADLYGETQYSDPIANANRIATQLREEEKCDLIICLSHLGYKYREDKVDDHDLATNSQDIDIILGGHTHTFLDEPTIVNNQREQPVIINQVGFGGLRLGRIDVTFSERKGKKCVSCRNEWVEG